MGQQLAGRYDIQQEIGHGGMARVYRALDTKLRRTVALKVLAAQLAVDPEFIKRFEREATLAGTLGQHPGIVTIFDRGEHDGLLYISMEFIEGRTLHSILKDHGALGTGYAVSILDPLCKALDYAHEQGAVHRDIKPHNIMISSDGRILLTDFGIAQPAEAEREGLTKTGTFMGTPEYIAPEQTEARRVDKSSDLYSLAIVAYEIITGRVPFSGSTPQLLIAHTQTPPPPPTIVDPTLPKELDSIFARGLAKNPHERFPNAAAFVEELRRIGERYSMLLTPASQTGLLADLATAGSSVGRPTIAVSQGTTPIAPQLPITPAPDSNAIPTSAHPSAQPYPVPVPQPIEAATAQPQEDDDERKRRVILWIAGAASIGILLFVIMFMVFSNGNASSEETPVAVPTTPSVASTEPPAPASTTPQPTNTPLPPAPVATPTEVSLPPTNMPAPTHTPVPTDTPVPTNTLVPTNTPTSTDTPVPTHTPIPPPPPPPSPYPGPGVQGPTQYPHAPPQSPSEEDGPGRERGPGHHRGSAE